MSGVKINDLHKATFEYNRDSYLTFEQAWDAKDWMKKHLPIIFTLIKDMKEGRPPTSQEIINDPKLWEGEHWFWFVNQFIKS